jgi:hypothetical protein
MLLLLISFFVFFPALYVRILSIIWTRARVKLVSGETIPVLYIYPFSFFSFFFLSSYISPHVRTYIHNIQRLNDRKKEEQVILFDLRFKIKLLSSSDHILLSCFVDYLNSKIQSDIIYRFC